jgi:outer membrane biosynthesis protein TonB
MISTGIAANVNPATLPNSRAAASRYTAGQPAHRPARCGFPRLPAPRAHRGAAALASHYPRERQPHGLCGSVSIQFAIDCRGLVLKLVFVPGRKSGSDALERAAVAGISASQPFPVLPAEFKGNQLKGNQNVLQFEFDRNMSLGQFSVGVLFAESTTRKSTGSFFFSSVKPN